MILQSFELLVAPNFGLVLWPVCDIPALSIHFVLMLVPACQYLFVEKEICFLFEFEAAQVVVAESSVLQISLC